jgi:DNA-binding transcriptional LysR family regulator
MFDNMKHQEILSLTLKQLRYAVAAADAGNVTRAAEILHVSQPSISVAIAQIEMHYGHKLFVRHKGEGVSPTAFGNGVIRVARKLLEDAGNLGALGRTPGTLSGEVMLGCFTDLAPYYVPALISRFAKAMPAITVGFRDAGFDELAESSARARSIWHSLTIWDWALASSAKPSSSSVPMRCFPPITRWRESRPCLWPSSRNIP